MFALYLCTSAAPKLTALTAKYYLLFQCNIFRRSMHHALLFCVYKHKHLGLKLAFQWGFFFFCAICCRQRTVSWSSEKSEQQLQWGRTRWSKLISELHITDLCQKHTEQQKWVFSGFVCCFFQCSSWMQSAAASGQMIFYQREWHVSAGKLTSWGGGGQD